MLILLVEDDRNLAANIIEYLALDQIEVDYASSLSQAEQCLKQQQFDVIVLDLNLPDGDGIQWCENWQPRLNSPILILTARGELTDRLAGFDAGADDYLIKPFAMAELVARLHAVKRRRPQCPKFELADLKINFATRELSRQGQALTLSAINWQILKALADQSPEIVTKAELERLIWNDMAPDSDALRSHLYRLRQTLDKPFSVPLIHSKRGLGVALREVNDDQN